MYNSAKPYTQKVLQLIQTTWSTRYCTIRKGIYPVISKKWTCPEVDHTDGIGTKGIYHWQKQSFKNAVIDALAMNLNDLALVRAIPYRLQNHIIIPEDNHKAILEIIRTLSKECRKRQIAITGGETSIHDNTKSLEISITMSGLIPHLSTKNARKEKSKLNQFHIGDALIGLKSNGLHSNGFTKVREVFGQEYRQEFIAPTKIYLDTILKLDKKVPIHGMMHITGGAYTKLRQILPKNCDIIINRNNKLKPQKIFYELYKKGINDREMYRTFNCGVGFIFSTGARDVKKILPQKNMALIGHVVRGGNRIKIESMFSNKTISQ